MRKQMEAAGRGITRALDERGPAPLIGLLAVAAAAFVLLLVLPGKSVAVQIMQDQLLWYDVAARLDQGQVPNVDFHSPLGPLTFVLLWAGYAIGGSFAATLPVATAIFTAALLPLLLYVSWSRLTGPLALGFGLYLLLLAVAPSFIGDFQPKPTFAMFYNRFGYALISLLFLFALPPRAGRGRAAADVAAMSVIVVALFYLKMTYALIAIAFLVGLLWFAHARMRVVATAVASAAAVLVIELFWSGTGGYITDIRGAIAATGAVRDGPLGLVATLVNNAGGVFLFAAVLLLALLRDVRWDYLLAALYTAAAGVLLDRHNSQGPGLLTFVPGMLILMLAPRRNDAGDARAPDLDGILLAAAFAFPVAAAAFGNLAFHFVAAIRSPDIPSYPPRLAGVIAAGTPTSTATSQSGGGAVVAHPCGAIPEAELLDRPPGPIGFAPDHVLAIIADGSRLLDSTPRLRGSVFALDAGTMFAAASGRPAPRGVDLFPDADITISESVHRPAAETFGDVDVIMVPKVAWKYGSFDLQRRLYAPYIRANYALTGRSACWDAYARKVPRVSG